MSAEPAHRPPRWYLALAAIAAGIHLGILVSLAALEIASVQQAEGESYVRSATHQLGRIMSALTFLFFRPEWTSWLRPYVGDDRWILGFLVALNSIAWGAALAGATWWWQRSGRYRRLLTAGAVIGLTCLAVLLFRSGVIYCHGDFSGILHCHSLFTAGHDH